MLERKILTAGCLLIALMSLGAVVYIIASGQLLYLDGINITLVCLLMAAIFGGVSLPELKSLAPALPPAVDESVHVHESGAGVPLFMQVWAGLLALTIIEVVLAYLQMPLLYMLLALMGLSIIKAALIIAYFMHLRFERLSFVLTLMPALVMCICLLGVFFPDSNRARDLGTKAARESASQGQPEHEGSHDGAK
jgi:cytochrome c oxidase subunit 4